MSLVPHMLNEVFEDLACPWPFRPGSIFDQNFGVGLLNNDLVQPHSLVAPLRAGYLRPWRHNTVRHSGISNIQNDQHGFKVNLDVQQFKPEEITVKTVDDYIVVEGKHEERRDEHGFISRQFQRRYKLPKDVDPEAVISKLSSDGVLSIEAPKAVEAPGKERKIQITHTNTPAVTSKLHKKNEKESEKQDGVAEHMDQ